MSCIYESNRRLPIIDHSAAQIAVDLNSGYAFNPQKRLKLRLPRDCIQRLRHQHFMQQMRRHGYFAI